MATILTIDQGSSSTKCLLVNEQLEVIARGSSPLREQHPRPGWVEHSAEEVFLSVQASVRACLEGQDVRQVVAVGISNQRESLVAWDAKTGVPLAPVVSWQDQRTAADCDALRSESNERLILERSGLPLDPMFSAAKARWLLDSLDPDRSRSKAGAIRLGTVDSFLLSRFGSPHVIEVGNASRTQLLDVRRASWSSELLELFGIPRQALPEIVSSRGPFPGVRGLFPLPDGVPVFAVMGDSHSALFAHGVFQPGRVKATFGTGSSVMGLVERPETLSRGICLTIGWSLDEPVFAAEGNIRATGQTLRFTADLFGMTPQEVAELAAKESSEGVVIVPGFNGLGAPYWDRGAVGLIANLTLGAGRGAVARAALESIPHQICDMVDAIDATFGRVSEILADGGPTRNAVLMQLMADLAGRPVAPSRTAELSALGVAHMAGLGAELWSMDSLARLDRGHEVYRPTMGEGERAIERRRWARAVARARGGVGVEPLRER